MTMTESDENNFSSSSPHRLPTTSASDALNDLSSAQQKPIQTGLYGLDIHLQGRDPKSSEENTVGGLSRGVVSEIFGPPGSGKTTFAVQVAANVLKSRQNVVWIDTSSTFAMARLKDIRENATDDRVTPGFQHFTTPTLSHLTALLASSDSLPLVNPNLIVIDCLSELFALAFPRTADDIRDQKQPKNRDATQWASGRRFTTVSDLALRLSRLAVTRNITILVLNQVTTRVRSNTGAFLHSAITGTAWEGAIASRVVLFRDWLYQNDTSSQEKVRTGIRFAGVAKAKGATYEGVGRVVAFVIEKYGLREIKLDEAKMQSFSPDLAPASLKRKRNETTDSQSGAEDLGSEDEFGWQAEDGMLQADDMPENNEIPPIV